MALLHKRLLGVGEKVCCVGVIRQRKVRDNTKNDARDTLNNHDPSPTSHALQSIHMTNAVRQQTTQRACNSRANEEIAHPQSELMLGVEEREVDVQSGEQPRLESTEEETACEEGGVGVYKAGEGGDETP